MVRRGYGCVRRFAKRSRCSVPLALEYEAVLTRPQNLRRAAAEARDADLLLNAILRQAEPVTISYLWRPTLRDPDDELPVRLQFVGRPRLERRLRAP